MDRVIDVWVSVFRFLIRTLKLIEVEVEIPQSLRDRSKWHIIVCNHQSWVDIVILQSSLRDYTPVLKFFTKRELIWVPFVGVAMWILGFPYVYRSQSHSKHLSLEQRQANEAVMRREGQRFLEKPVAVINFVEGSRFTIEKRDRRGSPYEHLLAPRRGGILNSLLVLEHHLDTVLDATIIYSDKVPGFWDLLSGRTTRAKLTVREMAKPNLDADALSGWLDQRWREKDQLLSSK